jgi:hypothetical protein
MHFPTYTKTMRQLEPRKTLRLEEIMSSYSCCQSPFLQIFGRTGTYIARSIGIRKMSAEQYYAKGSRTEIGRLLSSRVDGCGGQVIEATSVEKVKI